MMMSSSLSLLLMVLSLLVAGFYLFRLLVGRAWLHIFDAEHEAGHGMMAIGMACMLAPASFLTADMIRWNLCLCILAVFWFLGRLVTRKPLLRIFLRAPGASCPRQASAIHLIMYTGMGVMFALMSRITLLLTPLTSYTSCLFFVAFAFLTFFSGREATREFQRVNGNWLQGCANLAHTIMSAIMCWMFLGVLILPIRA